MRSDDFSRWIRVYLGLGVIWCLLTNLINTFTGAASAFLAATAYTGSARWIEVLKIIARQVLLWPLDIYERVVRPLIG